MKRVMLLLVFFFVDCGLINKNMAINNNSRFLQFTYEVKIGSTNGKKLEMWLPVPQSNEVQTISNLIIETNDLEHSIEDEKVHGNKYLYINQKSGIIKPTTVIITFDVLRKEHQNVDYQSVSPDKYLGAYRMVPTGGIFEKIIFENNFSKNNVRRIYNYVLEGMHYGKPKSVNDQYYGSPWLSAEDNYGMKEVTRDEVVDFWKKSTTDGGNYTFGNGNAIYACNIGVGNCTDYHSYFMSLDRTLGIPTRFHMGFSIPLGEEGRVDGYHCWADYFVKGEGWYPVDISEADKNPSQKDYYFGTLDYNRVEMVVGRDLILKGYESKITNLFIYPLIEINDKETSEFTTNFYYKNL